MMSLRGEEAYRLNQKQEETAQSKIKKAEDDELDDMLLDNDGGDINFNPPPPVAAPEPDTQFEQTLKMSIDTYTRLLS